MNEQVQFTNPYWELEARLLGDLGIEAIMATVDSLSVEDMRTLMNEFEKNFSFDGFKTKDLIRALELEAVANMTEFVKDMTIVVFVFLDWSNDMEKIISKSRPAARQYLNGPKNGLSLVKGPKTVPGYNGDRRYDVNGFGLSLSHGILFCADSEGHAVTFDFQVDPHLMRGDNGIVGPSTM
ncbi:unnamed protein product [Angiostrongylus costaricensis]|uniref:Protein-serine/threonine phosphatase n=1 Tax=Angiostrongylus costaricensis TaxID=334426 RepID=A0A0R3PIT9_ANGCS|nr:unnamed protein product [Angiostrongylus costaricensis]